MDEVVAYVVTQGGTTQRYYPHYNHLYSVAALTDSTGAVVERFTYDAYGRMTITGPGGVVRSKSAVGFDRGFTGYITDNETGLLHARARQYSPALGRFISRDPYCAMLRKMNAGDLGNHGAPVSFIKVCLSQQVDIQGAGMPINVQICRQMLRFQSPDSLPLAGDGYQDGMSLYAAWFVPTRLDPTGLIAWNCQPILDAARVNCRCLGPAAAACYAAAAMAYAACMAGDYFF